MQVILAVDDLARSLEFYEGVFGWPRNERIDYRNYVELKPDDGGTIGLYERDGYAQTVGADPVPVPADAVSPAYVYVRVEDAAEAADRLRAAGARELSPLTPRQWGETAGWFADPDGNVVAVAETTEQPVTE
jgi:uncharacterized protein